MIVGTGFIANNFSSYEKDSNIIIYASGIPNVANFTEQGIDREKDLLRKTVLDNPFCKIIYFSSCGIYDLENFNNYSIHKLNMEEFIKSISNNYLIFRLPVVVGAGANDNSLCQYFFNCIENDISFDLWKSAYRYLIDIDDVFEIIKFVLDKDCFHNEIVNISSSVKIKVLDIINILENFLDKKSNYRLCSKGSYYDIDISKLKSEVRESIIYKKRYAESILEKYYKKVVL